MKSEIGAALPHVYTLNHCRVHTGAIISRSDVHFKLKKE